MTHFADRNLNRRFKAQEWGPVSKDYDGRLGEDLVQIIQKVTFVSNDGIRIEHNVASQFEVANGATYFIWRNSYNEFVYFYVAGQTTVVNFQFKNASSFGQMSQFSCTVD